MDDSFDAADNSYEQRMDAALWLRNAHVKLGGAMVLGRIDVAGRNGPSLLSAALKSGKMSGEPARDLNPALRR